MTVVELHYYLEILCSITITSGVELTGTLVLNK